MQTPRVAKVIPRALATFCGLQKPILQRRGWHETESNKCIITIISISKKKGTQKECSPRTLGWTKRLQEGLPEQETFNHRPECCLSRSLVSGVWECPFLEWGDTVEELSWRERIINSAWEALSYQPVEWSLWDIQVERIHLGAWMARRGGIMRVIGTCRVTSPAWMR